MTTSKGEQDVLEPSILRSFVVQKGYGERRGLPPIGLGPSPPQNVLMTLATGKGHWAEAISTAEQLKQRCPGHISKIQQQEEDLKQR